MDQLGERARTPESSTPEITGARLLVNGIVQGVGFRPFVYDLATRHRLTGWVRNTSAGVEIEIDGPQTAIQAFLQDLKAKAPPLAHIDACEVTWRAPNGFTSFEITHSQAVSGAFQPISPDVSICADCLRELFDPQDRRYRYPFINCTNCGPRFTIIRDLPYDRPQTTMAPFEMCPDCAREYEDPRDRRFHAQPVACPACGPHIWLEIQGNALWASEEALQAARRLLRKGKIVAVKGLGGFHLACDATNPEAVEELRRRKLRVNKPFALMLPDLDSVRAHCLVSPTEAQLLTSPERPIVILRRKSEGITPPYLPIARQVAPGQDTLGVMLPYTPLHYLLLEPEPGFPQALVMTSGNLSEEPIAVDNQEARGRLDHLADAFLMHNRDIETRCDDSVVRTFDKRLYPLRRSRGYAPYPVKLPQAAIPLLATGAELKNAFCLTRERYAFLSHHIGDLENYETLRSFENGVEHLERLFRVQPQAIAYDLHPDYLATRYALERAASQSLPAVGVQHHHAHIAACMADNGLPGDRPVIGVAFDGTGFGDDGGIWGGEFLLADYRGYQRAFHLAYVPLPGGDAAIRQPWRVALAWLWQAGLPWEEDLTPVQQADAATRSLIQRQLEARVNTPPCSSMGRLFDAVAALAGGCQEVTYEAQAAIELEAMVDPGERKAYEFEYDNGEIDPSPMLHALVQDLRAGEPPAVLAARFHNGLARLVLQICRALREQFSVEQVALSGGVWQNMTLLQQVVPALRRQGFTVLYHHQVPTNDGGLALGQALIAIQTLSAGPSAVATVRGPATTRGPGAR